MNYAQTTERLNDYRRRIKDLRQEMRQVQARIEPQPVEDYRFRTLGGEVALSELFGDRTDLFVIHNMGTGCPNCTMWADGFNGVLQHLENRAAFVVCSPDDPATQAANAAWVAGSSGEQTTKAARFSRCCSTPLKPSAHMVQLGQPVPILWITNRSVLSPNSSDRATSPPRVRKR